MERYPRLDLDFYTEFNHENKPNFLLELSNYTKVRSGEKFRERQRKTDRDIARQRDRQSERDTKRQMDRQTDREREVTIKIPSQAKKPS